MKKLTLSCLAAATLAVVGCSSEKTDSEYVLNDAIWADMKVESDGEKSRVVAELNVSSPDGNNLNLTGGDSLSVQAAGVSKTLKKDTDFMDIDYQEYLDVTADDTRFTIALNRQIDNDVNESFVVLPKNFLIHGPLASDEYSLNDVMYIDWDGLSGDKTINLHLSSNCTSVQQSQIVQEVQMAIADDGQHEIILAHLNMFQNEEVDYQQDCRLNVTLERKTFGQVDSQFQSGSRIYAAQYRTVEGILIDN